ncbi:hypothetical protein Tco_0218125 [Tanacetum coccineum]
MTAMMIFFRICVCGTQLPISWLGNHVYTVVAAMVGIRHQGTYTTIILDIKEHKKDAPGVVSLDDVYPDQISEILEHLQRTGAPKVAKQTLPGANVALTGREAPWIPHLRAYMSATYSSTGGSRARALYKAGLRTPQAIVEAFIPEIAKTVFESASWDAQGKAYLNLLSSSLEIKNGACKIVLEKAEEARDATFSAFKALGVDVPRFPMNIIKKEPITSSREDTISSEGRTSSFVHMDQNNIKSKTIEVKKDGICRVHCNL